MGRGRGEGEEHDGRDLALANAMHCCRKLRPGPCKTEQLVEEEAQTCPLPRQRQTYITHAPTMPSQPHTYTHTTSC